MTAEALRVLIVSHLHPRLTRGGTEIAAHQQYEAMRAMPDVRAFFLAGSAGRVPMPLGVCVSQPFGPDEYVLDDRAFDDLMLLNRHPALPAALRDLLAALRPDVVHLHHVANVGLEFIHHVRTVLPDAAILMTLRDLGVILHRPGPVAGGPGPAPRGRASPLEDHRRFPEIAPEAFLVRDLVVRRFLGAVDHFVAPGAFLAGLHAEWGLPAERIAVIGDGPVAVPDPPSPPPTESGLVLGCFGPFSEVRGAEVLLDAAALLRRTPLPRPVRFEVHDDGPARPAGTHAPRWNLEFLGAPRDDDVPRLMTGCHAVVVPGLAWDEPALVIRQALAARRPVICSDIGGLAEAVRPGLDGFHVRAGSAAALAALVADLARDPGRLAGLQGTLAAVPDAAAAARETLALYGRVRAARAG